MWIRTLCVLAGLVTLAVLPTARAQGPADRVCTVSYVEVAGDARDAAVLVLRDYAAQTRKVPGNLRVVALAQVGRPTHFAVLEAWAGAAPVAAHRASAERASFQALLQPLRTSPYDERSHVALTPCMDRPWPDRDAIYGVTHADSVPTGREQAAGLITRLQQAGRDTPDNLAFEAWAQSSRLNHFTIVQAWKTPGAFAAHAAAPGTRQFREAFQPFSGSLYDERLYSSLDEPR